MNTPSIAFVLSSGEISGGTNVILRHAMQLADDGAMIGLISDKALTKEAVSWHPIAEVYKHPNLRWLDFFDTSGIDFDMAIATFWSTYFNLWKIPAANYGYFVQSIESRFYPPSERMLRNLVDATYDMPCGFVTEAKWIQRYLAQIHQQSALLVPNGVDKRVFNNNGGAIAPRIPGKLRVLVEGAVDVEFKNVPAAIRLARRAQAHEVWLLTPSVVTSYPGVDRVFSRVPHYATADIYRSCDILLKLSLVEGMFGPPLESFHCGGTCLVYDVTGHDEYIEHGINGIVVPTGNEYKVVAELKRLRDTPELLEALKRNAAATASAWPDWADSSRLFGDALQQIVAGGTIKQDQLARYSQRVWFFWISRDAATAAGAAAQAAFTLPLIERGLRHLREYGWRGTTRRTILWLRTHDIPRAQLRRAGEWLRVFARRAANRLLN
jgi:glycosyltransferase involved in cell wall biosynthesis